MNAVMPRLTPSSGAPSGKAGPYVAPRRIILRRWLLTAVPHGFIRRMCAPIHSLLRRDFAESAWAFLHGLGTDKLRDLVGRQLQDSACQMAVGEPKFI